MDDEAQLFAWFLNRVSIVWLTLAGALIGAALAVFGWSWLAVILLAIAGWASAAVLSISAVQDAVLKFKRSTSIYARALLVISVLAAMFVIDEWMSKPNVPASAALYLVPVAMAAVLLKARYAAIVIILSTACLNFTGIPPINSFAITRLFDAFCIAVFVGIAALQFFSLQFVWNTRN